MGPYGRAVEKDHMVSVLKERVELGDYRVDPEVVAAAMLARCGERSVLGDLCSKVLVSAQLGSLDARQRNALAGPDQA